MLLASLFNPILKSQPRLMAESNLKTTEIGVKMDPRLMAEVDLYGCGYTVLLKGIMLRQRVMIRLYSIYS